ncbi:MAG: right-handed parallel beta-helix repeat-containing protein [Planctomycetota bacterium]
MKNFIFVWFCLILAIPCQARIITVDDDGPADFNNIQAGIDDANDGDTVIVAPGITVKSENGPEDCVIDCNGTWEEYHRGFYFHSGEDANSILDGFTVTNAYTWRAGGGIHCRGSSPTITNCHITNNFSGGEGGGGIACWDSETTISNCIINGNMTYASGGGIYCWNSETTIYNCTISGNFANGGSGITCEGINSPIITSCTIINNKTIEGGDGGGISCGWDSNPTITNCIISNNKAEHGGGLYRCNGPITNCIISENRADDGAGMYSCNGTITNCTITGNIAYRKGGGLGRCTGSITNCTITGNRTVRRGRGGGLYVCYDSQITNCIIWNNFARYGAQLYNSPDPNYSCIQDWTGGGTANITSDPCFVDPGYWADVNDPNIIVEPNDPNAMWVEGDYHLLGTSPCIDTGDPNFIPEPNETDLDGNARLLDGDEDGMPIVDMGAYEYRPPIPADVDIHPDTLNLASKGRWISCQIRLPEDYNTADIDANSIYLEDVIKAQGLQVNDRLAIAKFSRPDVQAILDAGDDVEVLISGELTDGTIFEGTDTIKVLDK